MLLMVSTSSSPEMNPFFRMHHGQEGILGGPLQQVFHETKILLFALYRRS